VKVVAGILALVVAVAVVDAKVVIAVVELVGGPA